MDGLHTTKGQAQRVRRQEYTRSCGRTWKPAYTYTHTHTHTTPPRARSLFLSLALSLPLPPSLSPSSLSASLPPSLSPCGRARPHAHTVTRPRRCGHARTGFVELEGCVRAHPVPVVRDEEDALLGIAKHEEAPQPIAGLPHGQGMRTTRTRVPSAARRGSSKTRAAGASL